MIDDMIGTLRATDRIEIRRDGVLVSASIQDLLIYLAEKIPTVTRDDIHGVLTSQLREKAPIDHKHDDLDIDKITEKINNLIINRAVKFKINDW